MTRFRRILIAIAGVVGLTFAAGVIAIVAVVVSGVTIDVSRWRAAAAERATTALGRPVALDGPLELTLGRDALLRVGRVRILNPPGFTTSEFAALGDAHARFDLLAAVRGRLHVRSVVGTEVRLELERTTDGRANWIFAPGSSTAPPSRSAVQVGEITLRNVAIAYHDARRARRHVFAFDELSGSGQWDEPLRLALLGRAAGESPYALRLEGGPPRLLQEATAPWPFTLDFALLDTRLQASGAVDAGKGEARFDFDAGTEDLAQVERLLNTKLPGIGAASLQGAVVAAADAIEIVELHGVLGKSELAGRLALTRDGARPRVSGALTFATLDVRPFLAAAPDAEGVAPNDSELERSSLPLRDLVPVDVDLDVRVGQWLGLPGDVRAATFELHADTGGVRAPISVTVAGVPFSGRLDLDTAAATPLLAVRLDAKDAALGELAGALAGATGIRGSVGRFGLRAGGRGATLGALARDLELALAVGAARLRYGNAAGGRSIVFTFDELDVVVRAGERVRGSARGTLQGERATLSFRGGTVPDLLRSRATPVELDLAAAHAKLRVEGTLALAGATPGTDLTFRLHARRAGDLARWLGIAPNAKLPLALDGRVRRTTDAWHLDATTLRLGRSMLTIDAHRMTQGERPITVVAVRSPLVDVPELATLAARRGPREPASRLDVPLLPDGLVLADADIGLGLQRVVLGRVDLEQVDFAARFRAGRLLPSPFSAKLAGAPLAGLVTADLNAALPEATLNASAGAFDVAALLRGLGVAADIDGHADALQVEVHARGSTLRSLAEHSSFAAHLTGGSITVRGAADRPVAGILVHQGTIGALAGEPIRVRLDGLLDETPVAIHVASGTLSDFTRDAKRVPIAVAADAAGARFTLEGEALLPLGRGEKLTLAMTGERLDTLNGLAGVELPPWGPWSIRGPIRMTPTGYELRELLARVGGSELAGTGRLDVTGSRPRLDMHLTAPSIQLDDFPLPARLTEDPPTSSTAAGVRATARNVARQTQRLLSGRFLRRLDADLDVEVREVLSGTDHLADGVLHIRLSDGRLHLDPVQVNLPGGSLRLAVGYDPTAPEVRFDAVAIIERFDYGILARRLHRAEGVRGLFSLNLELAGTAPSLDTIMRHADGSMDFAVWPVDVPAGIFNFWSVNLLLAVLPLIDPGGESHVNCIVGRFDLKDGVLTDDKIMIDTTRVRVRGAGSANLRTEELAFVFRPRAKGFPLFRLQTPLRVTGTLTDYRFGVTQRDWVESILRLAGSPILIPLERLTLGPLPRDGADVCTDPLRE